MADSNVRPRASRDYGYEEFWQKRWAAAELFTAATRPGDPKYFIVELPPFANGRLHLGHVRNYTLGDVVAKFRRAAGWRVHYTTGFDAFGLPIENAAREEGCSPRTSWPAIALRWRCSCAGWASVTIRPGS